MDNKMPIIFSSEFLEIEHLEVGIEESQRWNNIENKRER